MNTFLLSINWNPSPELFNLFGLPVRYYGLLWAVGIFLAYIIVHYQYPTGSLPVLRSADLPDQLQRILGNDTSCQISARRRMEIHRL